MSSNRQEEEKRRLIKY